MSPAFAFELLQLWQSASLCWLVHNSVTLGWLGPLHSSHTACVQSGQLTAEAAAGRRKTAMHQAPNWAWVPGPSGWCSMKGSGIVHSHQGASMSLSPCCQSRTVPLSVEPSLTHVCLRRSRNWGSREKESGTAGEREIESMKNSQRPVKAKWIPGLVPVHAGGRGGGDTSKVSNFTPKSCALEKEITKEVPPKWRKEKSSKIQQLWLKGKEF